MLAAAESAAEDQKPKPQVEAGKPAAENLVDATGKTVQAAKESVKENVKNVTKPPSKQTTMQIGREIIANEGVKGLFRGGALRAVWTMLGAGLYLGVYESGRVYLAQRRGETHVGDDLDL
ncbi:hypothetical protein KC324_g16772 [Hortaea werneckii]|nr:hypothetical protein KC324_g16772 [Hortaea werneckii]